MSELYDVVFYGTDQQGEQLERIKARVAKLLQLDREKLESLFGQQSGVVLRSGVAQDIAQKYQIALTQAGVRCNSRPSKAEVNKLELVPLEKRPAQGQFVCPACGFQKKLEAGEPLPIQCEQCGVVPEKYTRISDEKMERERIKRALINRHKASVEEEQRLKDERAAKLRRQRLEQEIRKQLGLPRYLNSRRRLIGSAAAVLIAGVGIGLTSVMVYKEVMTDPSSSGRLPSSSFSTEFEQTMQRLQAADDGFTDVPGLAAVAQVAALSKDLAAGNQDGGSGHDRSSSSAGGEASQSQSQSLVLNMLGEMRRDREWDQFLTSIVRDLMASRQFADAYRISSQIQDDVQRIDLSGEVAYAFASADTTAAIIADLKTEAQGLLNPTDQVFALCRLAVHQTKAGNGTEAQQTAQEALTIADKINAVNRKAVAMSRVAATWAILGATRRSQEYFEQVNSLLASITDMVDRVSAYAAVAQGYADAGNKGAALRMLQETRQVARNINDGSERFRLLAEIAVYQAQLGDTDGAVATARSIEPVSSRDAVLFKTAADQLYSGHIYRAMAIAEPIETPTHEARAYALLARYQRGTELDGLAQENFDRAIGSSNLIVNDVDKAGILSEVARLRMRTGDADTAGKLFEKARLLVEDTGNAHTHDIASALIAKNQVRALQTVQAKKTLSTIADASIAKDVRDDIAQMDGTIDIVRSLMPLKTASSD